MAEIAPMEQFMVHKVVNLPAFPVPVLGSLDLSITNSTVFMFIAAALIIIFFSAAGAGKVVPGRLQSLAESFYDLVDGGLVGSMIGDNGRPFLPFIFTLFSTI